MCERTSGISMAVAAFCGLTLSAAARVLAADTAAPASDAGLLEEIVVTAQRRQESSQNTPLVVNVLSGADLVSAGATDVVRAAELIPGVHVLPTALSGAQIAIRGIVNNNVNVGADPSLTMSIDDVYIARAQAAFASFYDIQRIEVLRGPQGTLYGRNSVSGAMNVITNDPRPEWDANAMLEWGNYGSRTLEGMVNVPLSGKIAVRVSGQQAKHDGYIDHYWNDKDNQAARIKLLAEISEKATLVLSASVFEEGGVGSVDPVYPFRDPSNPWNPQSTQVRGQSSVDDHVYNYSARLNWDTGIGDLTYVRGYSRFVEDYVQPPSFIALHRTGTSVQDTDELRLASHSSADGKGQLSWIGGVFSYREHQDQFRHVTGIVDFGAGPQALDQTAGYPYVYADSLAEFLQSTYAVTDHWRVTGGVRNTAERKSVHGFNQFSLGPIATNSTADHEQSAHKVTWKAAVETDLTPTSLLYASVTTGFHGGGWQDAEPPYGTYEPETITSYEVGSKNELLDRRLRLNLGVYRYDYRNFLVAVNNRLPQNSTCACFVNAPQAYALGLELETQFVLGVNDRIGLNVAYESTDYSDFKLYEPSYTISLAGGRPILSADGSTVIGQDFSGTPFPYVSKWSGNINYQHIFRLNSGGLISAQLQSQLRTSYPGTLGNDPGARIGGYTKSDVTLTYEAEKYWSVSLWARNLERATAASATYTLGVGPVSPTNPLTMQIGEPRTYGVRLSAHF